jgi:hypothetical protein
MCKRKSQKIWSESDELGLAMRSGLGVVLIYANAKQNRGGGWVNISDFPIEKKKMKIRCNPLLPYIL